MHRVFFGFILLGLLVFESCEKKGIIEPGLTYVPTAPVDSFLKAMDVSSLSSVLRNGTIFKDSSGKPVEIFRFLKENGLNTLRFRVWVGDHPDYQADSILNLVHQARAAGHLIWIDLHYSHTWADPGNQEIPNTWNRNSKEALNVDLQQYTREMMAKFEPDIIQVGNEIDNGFLWPIGRFSDSSAFYYLLRNACKTVRESNPNVSILLHISNYQRADYFYAEALKRDIDFDIIGLSYYPKWHGYNTDSLFQTMNRLHHTTTKRVIIAENSYPFTFSWADWTNNVMGWEGDLHPDFPGTTNGQLLQVAHLVNGAKALNHVSGYAYWEGVWVASDGPESNNGSPWENQACFDFAFKALPVWKALK